MSNQAAMDAAKAAYDIEAACITEMKAFFDEEAFSKAVDLLSTAPRIGTAGCGHSGICIGTTGKEWCYSRRCTGARY